MDQFLRILSTNQRLIHSTLYILLGLLLLVVIVAVVILVVSYYNDHKLVHKTVEHNIALGVPIELRVGLTLGTVVPDPLLNNMEKKKEE